MRGTRSGEDGKDERRKAATALGCMASRAGARSGSIDSTCGAARFGSRSRRNESAVPRHARTYLRASRRTHKGAELRPEEVGATSAPLRSC